MYLPIYTSIEIWSQKKEASKAGAKPEKDWSGRRTRPFPVLPRLSMLLSTTSRSRKLGFLKHTLDEMHSFQWHTQTCIHLVFGWLVKKTILGVGDGGWVGFLTIQMSWDMKQSITGWNDSYFTHKVFKTLPKFFFLCQSRREPNAEEVIITKLLFPFQIAITPKMASDSRLDAQKRN